MVDELGSAKVSVMVLPVTPGLVAPPLSPENAGTHGGAYTDQVNCFTPGPQCAPATVWPGAPMAAAVDGLPPPAPPAAEMLDALLVPGSPEALSEPVPAPEALDDAKPPALEDVDPPRPPATP